MGQKRFEAWVLPAEDFILVATGEPGSTIELPENTRGLLVGTAGGLNVTMRNGNSRDAVPMIVGTNPGFFSEVRATVGGAQNIWAII